MKNNRYSIFALCLVVFLLISLSCLSSAPQEPLASAPPAASVSQEVESNLVPVPDPEAEADPEPFKPVLASAVPSKPIEVTAQGYGQSGQNVGISCKLYNPNLDLAIQDSQYQIAVKNAEGAVIGTTEGYISYIPEGAELGVATTMYLDEGLIAANIEIQVKTGEAVKPVWSGTFATEQVTYVPSEYYPSVRGKITNQSNQDISYMWVSALVYDDAGEIIGGGNGYLNFILANSSIGVIVPVYSSENVSRVELFPAISDVYGMSYSGQLPGDVKDILLTKQGFGQNNTSVGIGMMIENPNQGYTFEYSLYHVTSYSEDGSILGVSEGSINLLLPKQVLGVADSQYLDEGASVSRIEIQIKAGDFIASQELSTFTSENVTFMPDEYSPQVTGEIVNPYNKEVTDLQVDAIAYDQAGEIIGSGMTYLEFIPANSKAAVSVYLTIAGTPAAVELFTSVYSLSDIGG
jgi:hypothetical protein